MLDSMKVILEAMEAYDLTLDTEENEVRPRPLFRILNGV